MILIAPDKFKGTLTAAEVAETIATSLNACNITEPMRIVPMADGGEGTAEALAAVPINGMTGCYTLAPGHFLVVSSELIGKSRFDFATEHILDRSSYAVGETIRLLLERYNCKRIYVAVGGTATSDGGAGLLQALGYKFYRTNDTLITEHITPRLLGDIKRISTPTLSPLRHIIVGLIDVAACLYDGKISALTFAKQKGATDQDKADIADGLRNLADKITDLRHSDFDGAGGGLGFALASCIGCRCYLGGDFIVRRMHIRSLDIKLIISGEGSIDEQTEAGKVVKALESAAKSHGIPFIAIGGRIADGINSPNYFATMPPGALPPASKAEARDRLAQTCVKIAPLIINLLENN